MPLAFEDALCCSNALRTQLLAAGTPLQQARVIYEGITLAPYLAQQPFQPPPLNEHGEPFYGLLKDWQPGWSSSVP